MSEIPAHIRHLFELYIANQATDEQVAALFLFLQAPVHHDLAEALLMNHFSTPADTFADKELVWEQMLSASPSLKRRYQQRRTLFFIRWAAAAAIMAGILFLYPPRPAKEVTTVEIPAGTNIATLTLSNGSTIHLDSTLTGTIAHQGKTAIVKSDNGQIRYDAENAAADAMMMNTITTPMGGQFQLILPDGSHAWLNAASAITYPAAFVGGERAITVTGEVYLEVAKDPAHPFRVAIPHHRGIAVLGTAFNINAYGDDDHIITTLVEGRISMAGTAVVLKPGQQAIEDASAVLSINPLANIEKETAWKNGLFYFEDAGLPMMMKQIERWYNIKVQYAGTIPTLKINGKMDRHLTLQGVMDFLTKMDVNYTMKGRTMIVTGK